MSKKNREAMLSITFNDGIGGVTKVTRTTFLNPTNGELETANDGITWPSLMEVFGDFLHDAGYRLTNEKKKQWFKFIGKGVG